MLDRLKLIGKKLKNIGTTIRRKRAYSYYLAMGIFAFIFLCILVSGFSSSQKYKYISIAEGKSQPLGQANLTVVKREYNPKENLFRVDYWIDSENNSFDLTNFKIDTKAVTKNNVNEFLKTQVVQVDENYYVTFVKNVPKEFGTIKQFIYPGYLNLLKNQSDDLKGIEVKVYSDQSNKIVNNNLKLDTNKKSYFSDKIDYQIKLINQSIKEANIEITDNQAAIDQIKKSNKQIEEGLDTKLGEELERDQNKIQMNKSEIDSYKASTTKQEEQIKLLEEKIKLLKEKELEANQR
ncbi:hypothetical protein CKN63_13380 [Carnobacterium divergens]|uniref:hypothetical protein n=1 Tax=Carnobacterium divergens TaxID=2748 RepID=UPI001071964F|nr:hypothetical protein [Carnobacterium divergens]TFI60551.1 hypothetical protein CKN59_13315 [Carnobacterium divergens]TFI61650.1 hypothetical protein CKN76_12670 [Carnobacterium divergens]TFJ01026.1 hypothetical protein CKN75_12905 [Carnobacterium divergens]TFJ08946.1 hypothetical protein CKN71_12920 [Carnobacterium divergens]TFJ15655.1 hypothetical protein CKN63_13380 [Carnobacterium divergens]